MTLLFTLTIIAVLSMTIVPFVGTSKPQERVRRRGVETVASADTAVTVVDIASSQPQKAHASGTLDGAQAA